MTKGLTRIAPIVRVLLVALFVVGSANAQDPQSASFRASGVEVTGGGVPVPLTGSGAGTVGAAQVVAGRSEPAGGATGPQSGVRFVPGFFPVPEPGATALYAAALGALVGLRWRARARGGRQPGS